MDESREQPPQVLERRGSVSGLIDAYRVHRENLLKEAQALADLRRRVLDAADEDVQKVATAVREEIRVVLVRAQRQLLVLAAQVETATETVDPRALSQDVAALQPSAEHLRTRESLKGTQQQVQAAFDEVKPDFDALLSELDALRLRLRGSGHHEPGPVRHGDAKIVNWPSVELDDQDASRKNGKLKAPTD